MMLCSSKRCVYRRYSLLMDAPRHSIHSFINEDYVREWFLLPQSSWCIKEVLIVDSR